MLSLRPKFLHVPVLRSVTQPVSLIITLTFFFFCFQPFCSLPHIFFPFFSTLFFFFLFPTLSTLAYTKSVRRIQPAKKKTWGDFFTAYHLLRNH